MQGPFPARCGKGFFFQSSLSLQTLFRRQYYLWQPMWRCNDIFKKGHTLRLLTLKCVCQCTAAYRPMTTIAFSWGTEPYPRRRRTKSADSLTVSAQPPRAVACISTVCETPKHRQPLFGHTKTQRTLRPPYKIGCGWPSGRGLKTVI